MLQTPIELEDALKQRRAGTLLIDVRTPLEFAETTIPGAVNVPIFSNEERALVGTTFKQQGKMAARRLGVELVSPKIPELINLVDEARQGRHGPVIVFCWRGGDALPGYRFVSQPCRDSGAPAFRRTQRVPTHDCGLL